MNSPVTMSNTINNPYPCHPNMFITENYSSKFTIKKKSLGSGQPEVIWKI